MEERFIVELEGNHHYILIDTVTGHSYYTPAQADANSICGMLNSQFSKINYQRHHIKELETTLKNKGITFEPNRECRNCDYICLGIDNSAFCDLKEKSVALNDYCTNWKLSE